MIVLFHKGSPIVCSVYGILDEVWKRIIKSLIDSARLGYIILYALKSISILVRTSLIESITVYLF